LIYLSVVAGLDPATIHLRKNHYAKKMDPRVKPADDGVGRICVACGRGENGTSCRAKISPPADGRAFAYKHSPQLVN
jgi:hypothetical protein